MGTFLFKGNRPNAITYNGAKINTLFFNGVIVWQAIDNYAITGKLIGKGTRHSWDCNDSSGSVNDYEYSLQLTFSGVTRFPIKYISKTGATVSIEKSAVSNSGDTYIYTSKAFNTSHPPVTGGNCSESFSMNSGIEELKSIYPASGLSAYSNIASINITAQNDGVSNCVTEVDNGDCDCD